jgi:hypothetical protein
MRTVPITRDDWKLCEMPKSHATIRVNRRFSEREINKIKMGLRPESMDEKWFIFYERDRLYIHRSWTGYCIYFVRFGKQGQDHFVYEIQVNRNPKQYGVNEDSYDAQMAFWVIDFILLGHKDARMPDWHDRCAERLQRSSMMVREEERFPPAIPMSPLSEPKTKMVCRMNRFEDPPKA